MQNFTKWIEKPLVFPLVLLIIAFICYGLLINRLGYYWDDFPLTYIKNVYGLEGLERYFSTNRPFWGLLYQATYSIFNQPWQWQVNALTWRWLSGVILWLLLKEIWPKPKYIATWASMIFLVYPGFRQHHVSVIYSNLFFVMDCFLLSLYLNIKAVRQSGGDKPGRKGLIWQLIALVLSLYNLLALEYFFTLDLLRPLFIWLTLRSENYKKKEHIGLTLINWLPYLIVWALTTSWRMFFFGYQTQNYPMLFFDSIKASPFNTLIRLIIDIGKSFWIILVNAWSHMVNLFNFSVLGTRTTMIAIFISILTISLSIWYLLRIREQGIIHDGKGSVLWIGLTACLFGGIPLWLTGLLPSEHFPGDRFTLPFMLGVSLIIVGSLHLLPVQSWIKITIVGCLVGLAAGMQFQVTNQFRRDWETQRRFFWQLAWRIPGLDHGTTLMVNDLPVTYYSDNSLTAPLNWFWAPDNRSQEMSNLLLYPSQRLGKSLPSLKPEIPIKVDYLASRFNGSTSKVVAISYAPPACLRVLDKALDSDNRMLSLEMQSAAALSSSEWISPGGKVAADILPDGSYGPEPDHRWCYYFELADLARQREDWGEIAALGDVAYNINDYPNDPSEHFPFIEGYAHTGNWERAYALTEMSNGITPIMSPLLCRLWQRIAESTSDSPEKSSVISSVHSLLNCSP